MKNNSLTDAERMFTHAVMFKEGIVPMEDPHMDMRRALAGLSPEEARKMKRKFRKLWRRLEAATVKTKTRFDFPTLHAVVPSGETPTPPAKPTKLQKLRRKQIVHDHLRKTKILPLVKKFNSLKDVLT